MAHLSIDPSTWAQEPLLRSYGMMKLGQHAAIAAYARLLVGAVLDLVRTDSDIDELLVASTPRGEVPAASNLLAAALVGACHEHAPHLRLRVLEIRRRRRNEDLPRHYALLDYASREDHLGREQHGWFVDSDLRGRRVMLVDDVTVTGANQRQLSAFLCVRGARRVHFQYLVDMPESARDRAELLEPALNLIGVSSDEAFLKFLEKGSYEVTTRLLWRLIELPDAAFAAAVDLLKGSTRVAVARGILSEWTPTGAVRDRLRLLDADLDRGD